MSGVSSDVLNLESHGVGAAVPSPDQLVLQLAAQHEVVPGPVPGGRAQPHRLHPRSGREGDGGLPERGPTGEGGEEVRGTGLEVSLTGDQAGGRRGRGGVGLLLLLSRFQVELEGEGLQLLPGHRRPHRQVDQVAGEGGAGGGDRHLPTSEILR